MGGAKTERLAVAVATSVAMASFSLFVANSYYWRRMKSKFIFSIEEAENRIQVLEAALKDSQGNRASERQGRIRAQQALREAFSRSSSDNGENFSYPMAPIGVVHSCFSTRNGTPRQPLLVPLARASLNFYPSRAPEASLEDLDGFSHCWIIFVFHLNTDFDKLWKDPSKSRFKAKVRVPRLKGKKIGVFATRSPHRPCPIGLTVAKLEARHGCTLFVSDVDLVDGTPILDIKPYLPFSDSIQEAQVPAWLKEENTLAIASVNFSDGFLPSLKDCWPQAEHKSLYTSPEEFQSLVKQVLSWDIRSLSHRNRCHEQHEGQAKIDDISNCGEDDNGENGGLLDSCGPDKVIYYLTLECFDVSYTIDGSANVFVEKVVLVE